jgi:hypothetical protein
MRQRSTFGRRRRERTSQATPAVGQIRFGDLRRLTPISRSFGYDRGQPIDRYYIANFLGRHSGDIRGHVLEIGDDRYTRRFGGDRVTHSAYRWRVDSTLHPQCFSPNSGF